MFAYFPRIFKNNEVGRNDIRDYNKNYAFENQMLHRGEVALRIHKQKYNETLLGKTE